MVYVIRLSDNFKIPGTSNEKPSISNENLENLGF